MRDDVLPVEATVPTVLRMPALASVSHGVSSRGGGVSPSPYASLNLGYGTEDIEANVSANRSLLFEQVGIAREHVVSAWLTHGKNIAVFSSQRHAEWPVLRVPMRHDSTNVEPVFKADAVISDVPKLRFLLTFADCVPLLFFDPVHGVVAAAHAGWRGTAQGIAGEVVRAMSGTFGSSPATIVAAIGPSIGPCCYTVASDVPATFAKNGLEAAVQVRDEDMMFLDLWASNERQLSDAGIPPEQIDNPRICTACHTDTYFSHRAEGGVTGRFGAYIGLK